MQDKELIARGAECVCGDLILGRTVVGHYRNGQFIITPEGADELANVVEVKATEVKPVKTVAAKTVAAKTAKASKAPAVEAPAEAPADPLPEAPAAD